MLISDKFGFLPLVSVLTIFSGAAAPAQSPVTVTLSSTTRRIPMGETASVTALCSRNGKPALGVEIWSYLNGKRWGAQGHTGGDGSVRLLIPLPHSGTAAITAIAAPEVGSSAYKAPGPFPIGEPPPSGVATSNTIRIDVVRSKSTPATFKAPEHRIGMDWEPWFTPLNAAWSTAEAAPLLGYYASINSDVIRQHILWMNAVGVDFLLLDWSNNIWGCARWSEHPPGVDQLVASTLALLHTLAEMKREGLPVPQVTLLLGLINGPPAKMSALNEELAFVHQTCIAPIEFNGLWVEYLGKPFVTVLDTLGPDYLKDKPPIDDSQFTIRWMSTLLEHNNHAAGGFWSWMDGVLHPVVTQYAGKPEALTITPAFFGAGGWTYPAAMARRGGATFVEQFRYASEVRPTFRRREPQLLLAPVLSANY